MSIINVGLLSADDNIISQSLNHRVKRNQNISANIANSETPGYRAIAYEFENELGELAKPNSDHKLKTTHSKHMLNNFTTKDGKLSPNVYIRPTESIGHDGNTVDMDKEMALMAENQILFRASVEALNRKVGLIKYAINGGR